MIGAGAVTVGRVVLQHRSKPQGRHAKFVEVVKVLADALQVAAMPEIRVRAVALVAVHRYQLVVLHRARGKAVRHQLIEHIGAGKTDALLAALLALLQLILDPLPVYLQHHFPRPGIGHVQIDQQIVGAVESHQRVNPHSRIVRREICITHIFSVDHQLQRRILHPHIPVRRLNALHLRCMRNTCNISH